MSCLHDDYDVMTNKILSLWCLVVLSNPHMCNTVECGSSHDLITHESHYNVTSADELLRG